MNLKKIEKFSEFVSEENNIVFSDDFKLIKKSQDKFSFGKSFRLTYLGKTNKNEVIIELGSKIIVIYNKSTTRITCMFVSEPEYIQSEYILLNPSKIATSYIKPIIANCTNPTNCLVIGLCLGNVPNTLVSTFGSLIKRIDCVDINLLLCKFFNKYLANSSLIHVYPIGGFQFIKSIEKSRSYSFVSIDIPCKFITKQFMNKIDLITQKYSDRKIVLNIIGDDCVNSKLSNSFENFKLVQKKKIESNLIYVLE